MNSLKKSLTALAISSVIAFSSQTMAQESISDPELKKVIEMLKLEMAQHTGIQAYYDEESNVVTLSGILDDPAYVASLITKLKSMDHIKGVRSSITHD